MSTENASMFDCPNCDVTAPSAAVPYDTLGYSVCPFCRHSSNPLDGDR
ncbi:hypothetical protein [Halorubrum sp. DTA46]